MRRFPVTVSRAACCCIALSSAVLRLEAQPAVAPATSSPDRLVHAIAYVEVLPSAVPQATAALERYREQARSRDGFVRCEIFEQLDRPGHLAVAETWRDQASFDAREPVAAELSSALAPIRVSGFDQRPYKTLSVAPVSSGRSGRPISVIAHVDVIPNPRAAEMLQQLAESSRAESGNLRFDVLQHAQRANHFTVIETWRDHKAYDAHVAAAHTRRYRDELQPLTGSPLDERLYRMLD